MVKQCQTKKLLIYSKISVAENLIQYHNRTFQLELITQLKRMAGRACGRKTHASKMSREGELLYKATKIVLPFPVHNEISDSWRFHRLS